MPDLLFRLGVLRSWRLEHCRSKPTPAMNRENTDQNKKWPGWWKRRIIRRRPTHRNTGAHQRDADHLQDDASPCQPTTEARFLRIT